MKQNDKEKVTEIYKSDSYIKQNPSLHTEDSNWKINKIMPLINYCTEKNRKKTQNILDVGGGAGLILKEIYKNLTKKEIKVNQYVLDLSPGMLKTQKKNNPKIKFLLQEDIRKTSLEDKEIDISLMIDVIEHIPEPNSAISELNRISKFVIFKLPLEKNLIHYILNVISFGYHRKKIIKELGHINVYSFNKIKMALVQNGFKIIEYFYTNSFEHQIRTRRYEKKRLKTIFKVYYNLGNCFFKFSPKICSLIFSDFVIILAESNSSNETSS